MAINFVQTNQSLLVVIGAILVMLLIARAVFRLIPKARDPRRAFTPNQRQEGFARANGRCEMEGFLWFRCGKQATDADHHYPWSRGGATSMANFVAACGHCNKSKGAKVPTRFSAWRMAQRRKGYFTKGSIYTAGDKFNKRKSLTNS